VAAAVLITGLFALGTASSYVTRVIQMGLSML